MGSEIVTILACIGLLFALIGIARFIFVNVREKSECGTDHWLPTVEPLWPVYVGGAFLFAAALIRNYFK
jgi:hypothetical protein